MIKTVAATRLREILGQVLDQVRYDRKAVAITRNNKTVAWIVPADPKEEDRPTVPTEFREAE
jgi:prevent-host-death family protein